MCWQMCFGRNPPKALSVLFGMLMVCIFLLFVVVLFDLIISVGIMRLRKEKRILGNMIGSLPGHPSQNTQLALPLSLLPEEVTLCVERSKKL